MDWKKFQEAVEDYVQLLDSAVSIKTRVEQFIKLLTDAANTHVGKVKPGKRTKTWMNPNICTAIRKRNRLRRNLKSKEQRREWLTSCKDANDAIQDSKRERAGETF